MSEVALPNRTILVVDDVPTNLGLLVDFLSDAGFTVLVAETGESAIQRAEYALPDLILLDVLMPGIDGFETCRQLKSKALTRDIPIIFMTGLSDPVDKVKGLELGAVDYILKPLQCDEVLARVNVQLRLRHLTQQLQEQNTHLEKEVQMRRQSEAQQQQLLQQAQLAQQDAERARHRSVQILESITDAFIALDRGWRFIYLNHQAERLLKQQRDELIGESIWDTFPDAVDSQFYAEYQRAMTEQVSVSFEAYSPQLDSWLEVHAYPAEEGLSIFFQDISVRKQVQEELRQQTLRSQLFAEVALRIRQSLQLEEILQTSVNEVQRIFKADRVLILRFMSQGVVKVVTETVTPPWPSVIEQKITDDCFGAEYTQLYQQGRVYMVHDVDEVEHVHSCLANFMRQFNIRAKLVVPLLLKEELWGLLISHQCDRPRHWTPFEIELFQQLADQIGIALTQAQLLAEEKRQRQELARSNTDLQQFAYVASHDLQEPLRMVTSYLQLLERRYKHQLDESADDFIAFAVDGATRMRTLINDLLTYSRVGTHGKPFQQVNCTAIVEQVITNLKVAIADANATITYDPLPTVTADATQLTQLFQNLISNAIKFQHDQAPIVHIGIERQDEEFLFSIRDNGIGIEPQYVDRIFVIFQRLHNRTEYSGTGIGLAVCKKIVERHGGRIWVESALGHGSTFYFTLPYREDALP